MHALTVFFGVIGTPQIIIILVVVLLLFGGKKKPELIKRLGSGIKEFKKAGGPEKRIKVELVGFKEKYNLENTLEENRHTYVKHT